MKLFADSGSDLPKDYFAEHNVTFLPMQVHLEKGDFQDVLEIHPSEVYQAIERGEHPKTSQISLETLNEEFMKLAESGEEGLYIAFSSGLSGTYQSAVMVKNQLLESYPTLKLEIIDSKCASLGLGLLVRKAVELSESGILFSDLVSEIQRAADHTEHIFTVKDLDYLAKGGRLSKAGAFLGGLLSINPILNVDDGRLVPINKVRGRKKTLSKMIEIVKERGGNTFPDQVIGICHGDDMETALQLKEMAEKELKPKEIMIEMIGSAIGAHGGMGTAAILFLNKSYYS